MTKAFWLLSAGAAAIAAPAWGQTPAQEQPATAVTAEQAAVDETPPGVPDVVETSQIIVTATRRNLALSDVPLAVSAISGETMENSGASDIRQLQQLTPSLLVSSTQSEAGATTARIRGVGTVGDNPGLESSVAVFIDGVYRARNAMALTELGPVERVEVLRGPQGTLFGRNASAGILSIITARPRFETEGRAELTIGNYGLWRGELGATGGITETLAGRFDLVYLRRDGFLTDVISGRDLNDRERLMARGQLLYEPNSDFSFRLIADYTTRDEECCGAVYLRARDHVLSGGQAIEQPSTMAAILRGLGATIIDDPSRREMAITPGLNYMQDVEDWGISGELNYNFGAARLTSITAYRSNDYIRGQDADFNNLDILRRSPDGRASQQFSTFTQELRLQGETWGGRLDWLVGGFFSNESLDLRDNLQFGGDYERFANCLLFASVLPAAMQPTPTGQCVNVPVVQGTVAALVAQRQALLDAGVPPTDPNIIALTTNINLLGALVANPARPGFGSLAAALGQPAQTLNFRGIDDRYDQNARTFAIFTHNIFELMSDLHLTVGLRYTHERKTLDATLTDNNVLCAMVAGSPLAALMTLPCVIPSVPGGTFTQSGARYTDDALSGTAVLSYKPMDRLLTYVSFSRGYKAGGFNLDRSALPRQVSGTAAGPVLPSARLENLIFEPETVNSFEIGAKYDGVGFDVNVAAFYQVFENFQLNTFNGLNFVVENINSCKQDLGGADSDNNPATGACPGDTRGGVVSKGIELEIFTRPTTYTSLNLGAGLIDTRYRDNLVGAGGRPMTPALFQLPGERLSNSSLWSATASFTASPPIGNNLVGLFYIDGRYQSRFNTGSDLDLEKVQDSIFTVNARIGIRSADMRWAFELWAQNLFDEDYMQVAFDAPIQGGGTIRAVERGFTARSNQLFGAFLAEPRTYGVTARFRF